MWQQYGSVTGYYVCIFCVNGTCTRPMHNHCRSSTSSCQTRVQVSTPKVSMVTEQCLSDTHISTRIARATVSLAALASAPLPRAPQAAALHTVSQGLGLPPAAPPPAHNLRTSHREACTPQTPRIHGFNGLYFVTPSWHCVKLDGRGDTHSDATMILCDRPQTLHALQSR